jgi:hypothetical protein
VEIVDRRTERIGMEDVSGVRKVLKDRMKVIEGYEGYIERMELEGVQWKEDSK